MDAPLRPGPSARPPAATLRRDTFREWTRRIRTSDRSAFASLYHDMSTRLVRYARTILLDEEASYDVLQDVFLKLWERRDTLDPEASLQALLYTMTRNACLNVRRKRGFVVNDAGDESGYLGAEPTRDIDADQRIDAETLEGYLDTWIQELPERRREAFLLSRQHELTHKEISDLMGLSERTVDTHIFLALKDLRLRLNALNTDRRQP